MQATSASYGTVGEIRAAARADATEVLGKFWGTPAPIPVDPVSIARAMGLSVFSAELGEDVWGMLSSDIGGSNIYLDRDQPQTRYRFSCAHELGHFVDRGAELTPGQAFIDRRSDEGIGRADEVYANEFAGSLLMPDATFRRLAADYHDFDLARLFQVSVDAVRYRRRLLGL